MENFAVPFCFFVKKELNIAEKNSKLVFTIGISWLHVKIGIK